VSTPSPIDVLVQRILSNEAPVTLRAAAARGALPIPRAILARLFLHLRNDPQDEVRTDAEQSLAALGGETLREVLSDPACPKEVMEHFAPAAARNEALAEVVAFHPSAPERALAVLASEGTASVIDLVLTNQERLLAFPSLIDRLSSNPALRTDQRGKILDLLATFFKDGAGGLGRGGDADAAADETIDAEQAARWLDVDPGELFAASEIEGGEEFAQAADPVIRSVYSKILTLTAAQKAMLAMRGGREERLILVRDTNKVVALSVLKNARLTEQEVEGVAAMRNVSDEVLRAIGSHREWCKSYTVMRLLVSNPRTPPSVSTNFIPHLSNRDLKQIAMDKNVPEIIRRNAKRTFDLRTQKTTRPPGKK
jgi:hypothetical protein